MKKETVRVKDADKTKYLPVITVYILGYDLSEFDCRAIRIDNRPFDIIGQKDLSVEGKFVELLTHQSFILLACKKEGIESGDTRLEKFLNLFIQKLRSEEANTIVDIEPDTTIDPELRQVIDHLNQATLNEELVRRINAEKEHEKSIADLEKEVEEERRQKEEAKAREDEANIKLAKFMLKQNISIEKISKETNLTTAKIEALKKTL